MKKKTLKQLEIEEEKLLEAWEKAREAWEEAWETWDKAREKARENKEAGA